MENKAMRYDLIGERIQDKETGAVGLVVEVSENAAGEEFVLYVSTNPNGDPVVTFQKVANIILIVSTIWETIFPLIKDAIQFFFGNPAAWKERREARRAAKAKRQYK
jgi:hypothetical protein